MATADPTPPPGAPGLTPDLIERVRKLSAEDRDRLRDILDEDDLPPVKDIDWAAEIKRRSDDYHAGRTTPLSREESDAHIRAEIRKLGFELP